MCRGARAPQGQCKRGSHPRPEPQFAARRPGSARRRLLRGARGEPEPAARDAEHRVRVKLLRALAPRWVGDSRLVPASRASGLQRKSKGEPPAKEPRGEESEAGRGDIAGAPEGAHPDIRAYEGQVAEQRKEGLPPLFLLSWPGTRIRNGPESASPAPGRRGLFAWIGRDRTMSQWILCLQDPLSSNQTEPYYDLTSNAVLTFIYFVVCIIGLCGNTLVIYVILRYAKMKTITNIYILNLAIADELFMLGLPFLAMQVALVHWPFGKAICRVVMTVDGINQFTSIFCLTVMSVDRYLAVVHPIKSAKWRRPRTAKMINVAVWGVSLLVILPIMIYAGLRSNQWGRSSCTINWPGESGAWYTGFIIYTFILGFLVPLTIICLCYLFIIIKVKSSGIRVGSSKRKKSEKKVTRMVSIVVAVFIFCWLPFYIFNVSSVSVAISPTPALKGMFDFVVVLTYANSCANPILYAFLSDNFKKSFQNVLCLVKVSGTDDGERSDSKQDKSRLNETTETQRTLLNGDLQTSI
ncbi:hypothetical protein HPG69_018780 [Diceros bicornis minor]|uniref:Somatostatin receptor type 2 n=2 Tax=Laurasiatheria TaxID=314145 RepID=A0A7J7F8P4_DICBM|nr:hypothetical protein HPG69_018780 [Diceros bicornis minor]